MCSFCCCCCSCISFHLLFILFLFLSLLLLFVVLWTTTTKWNEQKQKKKIKFNPYHVCFYSHTSSCRNKCDMKWNVVHMINIGELCRRRRQHHLHHHHHHQPNDRFVNEKWLANQIRNKKKKRKKNRMSFDRVKQIFILTCNIQICIYLGISSRTGTTDQTDWSLLIF